MGGSFLGGWLAGDLATRNTDNGAEEISRLNTSKAVHQDVSMAAVGAVMGWKATAHGLRARLNARRETEEELLEQLTAADVRVPLSDPTDFGHRVDEKYAKNYTDTDVISETYDGELPPNLVESIEDWKKEKGIE